MKPYGSRLIWFRDTVLQYATIWFLECNMIGQYMVQLMIAAVDLLKGTDHLSLDAMTACAWMTFARLFFLDQVKEDLMPWNGSIADCPRQCQF